MKRAAALVCGLLLISCGSGGGGTSPDPPPPSPPPPPVVRSGATDTPVAAEVQPPSPALGASVVVRAPGFLVREQVFGGEPIRLWPDLGQELIRSLCYSVAFEPGVPSGRLVKWTRSFSVTGSAELMADPAFAAALQAAAAEASRASGLPVDVAPGAPVTVVLDPGDPLFAQQAGFGAFTVVVARNDRMESARIVVRDVRQARRANLLSHELGHVLGLSHVADPGALMFVGVIARDRFDEREALCLRMMYAYRDPGNRFPDREAALGGATAATRVAVFADCEQGMLREE